MRLSNTRGQRPRRSWVKSAALSLTETKTRNRATTKMVLTSHPCALFLSRCSFRTKQCSFQSWLQRSRFAWVFSICWVEANIESIRIGLACLLLKNPVAYCRMLGWFNVNLTNPSSHRNQLMMMMMMLFWSEIFNFSCFCRNIQFAILYSMFSSYLREGILHRVSRYEDTIWRYEGGLLCW